MDHGGSPSHASAHSNFDSDSSRASQLAYPLRHLVDLGVHGLELGGDGALLPIEAPHDPLLDPVEKGLRDDGGDAGSASSFTAARFRFFVAYLLSVPTAVFAEAWLFRAMRVESFVILDADTEEADEQFVHIATK